MPHGIQNLRKIQSRSELTENSKPFRRMMRKDRLIDWLENDELQFDSTLKKSELLEIAFNNKTRKEYKV
jgi:hypothetical protein